MKRKTYAICLFASFIIGSILGKTELAMISMMTMPFFKATIDYLRLIDAFKEPLVHLASPAWLVLILIGGFSNSNETIIIGLIVAFAVTLACLFKPSAE